MFENSLRLRGLFCVGGSGKGLCFGAPSEAHQNINKKTLFPCFALRVVFSWKAPVAGRYKAGAIKVYFQDRRPALEDNVYKTLTIL